MVLKHRHASKAPTVLLRVLLGEAMTGKQHLIYSNDFRHALTLYGTNSYSFLQEGWHQKVLLLYSFCKHLPKRIRLEPLF